MILKKIILLIFFIIGVGCSNEKYKRPDTPELIAKQAVIYKYTLNVDGTKSIVTEKCSSQMANFFARQVNRGISESLEKENVSYNDINAHDFSNLRCDLRVEEKNFIILNCSGQYNLKKASGEIFLKRRIDEEIKVRKINGELFYLPPVCEHIIQNDNK